MDDDTTIHELEYARVGRGFGIHPEEGSVPAILLQIATVDGLELSVGMEPSLALELAQKLTRVAKNFQ